MNLNEFNEELKKLGITLSAYQLDELEKFYKLLVEWNQKINLTRIIEKEDVYLKHFYDSLTIVKVIDLNKVETLCDVGTGAGFPGIVLKIFYPHLKISLVDSLQKRVNFLNLVIKELELDDIVAIHARAEIYAKDNIFVIYLKKVFIFLLSEFSINILVLFILTLFELLVNRIEFLYFSIYVDTSSNKNK